MENLNKFKVRDNLLIIKLGGSVITFKERPLSPNYQAIDKIANIIKELKKTFKIIIVHGGGSFGHYWSVKYDMHTMPFAYSDEGVAKVRESMIKLNSIIVEKLIALDIKPFSIQASSFVFNNLPYDDRILDIADMIKDNGLTPITYGDVIYTSNGNFSILSGDSLMKIMSKVLKPKLSIFTTNVDGIYDNITNGNLVPEILLDKSASPLTNNIDNKIQFSELMFDVTGGMKRKISESIDIVNLGIPVYLINGFYPERILDVINGNDFIGTSIKLKEEST